MDPLTIGLFAGGGLLKSLLVDKPREDRDRKLAAATQKYSPWTGLKAQPIREADPLGSAMQFGASGAAFGQGLSNQEQMKQLQEAQIGWLNRGGSPMAPAAMSEMSPGLSMPGSYGQVTPWSLGNYRF